MAIGYESAWIGREMTEYERVAMEAFVLAMNTANNLRRLGIISEEDFQNNVENAAACGCPEPGTSAFKNIFQFLTRERQERQCSIRELDLSVLDGIDSWETNRN